MIYYASQVGRPVDKEKFDSFCLRGLKMVGAEKVLVTTDPSSICRAYNDALDWCKGNDDLEALVLIHADAEILDPEFESKVLHALQIDDIGILGVIGSRGAKSLAWWEGSGFGRVHHSVGGVYFCKGNYSVELLDGLLMVMSPWAVRNLRFDEDYDGFHGYSEDICFQSLKAGKRNLVLDIEVRHHTRGGFGDIESWKKCNLLWKTKWKSFLEGSAPSSESTPSSTPSPS